jgi:hypothetical protein
MDPVDPQGEPVPKPTRTRNYRRKHYNYDYLAKHSACYNRSDKEAIDQAIRIQEKKKRWFSTSRFKQTLQTLTPMPGRPSNLYSSSNQYRRKGKVG